MGYRDWLLPAASACPGIILRAVKAAELVAEEIQEQAGAKLCRADCLKQIGGADSQSVEALGKRFSFRYPYPADIRRKNKYSVSELKHRAMRERLEQEETELVPAFLKEDIVPYIPSFAEKGYGKEGAVNQGALRGTAMHRVMECYCFSSGDGPEEQLGQMLKAGRISEEQAGLVRIPLIERFLASGLGARIRAAEQAGKLYREKPFVMGLTAGELAQFGFGEMLGEEDGGRFSLFGEDGDLTLVQGIIDAFWEEEDGIVLLDYKTDRVDTSQQLVKLYAAQLMLYGEALERVFCRGEKGAFGVKERFLYSFRLGEAVLV